MSFPRYPAYKDSGVEWLGEVPQNWSVYSLKRTVDGCVNGLWGDEPDGENDIAVIRVADFERSFSTIGLDKLTYRSITPKERQSRLIKSGDLLIEKSGGGEKTLVGCVVLFKHEFDAITSNFVARMRPLAEFDSQFLCYAFGNLYRGRVNYPSVKQVTGIQNLDAESYLQERFCFPARVEQTQIARFLDHETASIDALIEEQQRLIELLKEKRQAVISHAVTKGLDPTVTMKDSGVEWLGEVPAHWDVARVKNIAKLESGHTPSKDFPEYWEGGDIPWISLNDSKQLKVVDYIDETQYMITALGMGNSSARLLPARAVVFTRDATIGLAAITTQEMCVSQHLIAWVCNENLIIPEYLLLVFYAMEEELGRFTFGATLKTIGMPDVRKLTTTVPPLSEQAEVVAEVSSKRGLISRLISESKNGIALLQERRSSLISAAVTGKIDVRGWEPPASALTPELARGAV